MGTRFTELTVRTIYGKRHYTYLQVVAFLLRENPTNLTAVKGLRQCAEVYEYLSKAAEKYDRKYCKILSALCYDISGYQANALCIMRDIDIDEEYSFNLMEDAKMSIDFDNYVLSHVKLILNKKYPLQKTKNLSLKSTIITNLFTHQ